jgi:hypothetical protein
MATGAAYDATIGGDAVKGSIPAPASIAVTAAANDALPVLGAGSGTELVATATAHDATVAIT